MNIANMISTLIYTLPAILLAISMHEFAHGYISYRLGDITPKMDGRLTLNPFKHLDLWGTICLVVFRMGWAKPVRINVRNYKNPKRDIILVSLAGPAMNFILAFISMFVYGIFYRNGSSNLAVLYLANLCYYSSVINVGLGVFNLIPIPPLDGSNVLGELIPQVRRWYLQFKRYAPWIIAVLLFSGILSRPLSMVNQSILNGLWSIVRKILHIVILPSGGAVSV